MKKDLGRIIFTIAGMGALAMALIVAYQLARRQISPTDSSALYGGEVESGYLTMGYLVSFLNSGGIEFCSVSFFSPTSGVSAGHCFAKPGEYYVGRGDFTLDTSKLIPVANYRVSPNWNHSSSDNDVATFTLNHAIYSQGNFTSMAQAVDGCNYRVVAYGRTEEDVGGINPQRPKRSANICLASQGNGLLRINSFTSGLCMGDSGSPIFIEGTNTIVAVVSAISRSTSSSELCYIGNTGIGVAVVPQTSFLQAGLDQPITFASDVTGTPSSPTTTPISGDILNDIPTPLLATIGAFLLVTSILVLMLRRGGQKNLA